MKTPKKTDSAPKRGRGHKCIYGIHAKGDPNNIVYVGQTNYLSSRMYCHRKHTQNEPLSEWMSKTEWTYSVIEDEPQDINEAEKKWIKHYGLKNLFNMVHGGEQNWRHHDRKPWMAKNNINCPSSIVLLFLRNRCKGRYFRLNGTVSAVIKNMNDKERVFFEIGLAKDFYKRWPVEIEKWLSYTEERLITALES